MNRLAARHRFVVLYPEQERVANAQGCWNWFERRNGRAEAEAATLLAAVDKVARRLPVDLARVAVAGLSAGASMAVLMAALFPHRFCAVAMHSGVAPGTAESAATALAAMHGRQGGGRRFGRAGRHAGMHGHGAEPVGEERRHQHRHAGARRQPGHRHPRQVHRQAARHLVHGSQQRGGFGLGTAIAALKPVPAALGVGHALLLGVQHHKPMSRRQPVHARPVSYTHLTLPTNREV